MWCTSCGLAPGTREICRAAHAQRALHPARAASVSGSRSAVGVLARRLHARHAARTSRARARARAPLEARPGRRAPPGAARHACSRAPPARADGAPCAACARAPSTCCALTAHVASARTWPARSPERGRSDFCHEVASRGSDLGSTQRCRRALLRRKFDLRGPTRALHPVRDLGHRLRHKRDVPIVKIPALRARPARELGRWACIFGRLEQTPDTKGGGTCSPHAPHTTEAPRQERWGGGGGSAHACRPMPL